MARGPGAHQAGPPQQRQPAGSAAQQAAWPPAAAQDAQGWPQPTANGWPAQGHYAQAAPQAYQPQQPVSQPQPAAQPAYDPLGRNGEYHYPQTAPPQPRTPAPAPQQPAQPQYAPQFDAYVPPSRPTSPPVPPAPQQAYQPQQPAPQSYAAPPLPAAARAQQQPHPLQQVLQASHATARPDLRGTTHDQWPTAPAQAQAQAYPPQPQAFQQPPQADPRGYDLGHYAPASGQAAGYEPSLQSRTYTQPHGDWAQQGGPHHVEPAFGREPQPTYAQQPVQQPSLDPSGYANEHPGYETGQELTAEQDYGHEEVEYEEEAPRRSKGLIIVGALVGAIALGGGLAYGYKTFMAPPAKGKVPVVRNDGAPSKVQPVTPGGKQFANTDSKVLNGDGGKIGGRLGGDGASMSGSSMQSDDGAKRVQVLSVTRDGQVMPPQPSAPQASNPIPGLVLADGGLGGPRPAPPQAQPAAPSQQASAPAEAARVQPKVIIAQPQQAAAVAAPPPSRQAPPPPAVIDAKSAAAAQSVSAPKKQPVPAKPATASSPGVGAGWVAVLASQRSSVEALQAFADLKQKYPDLLQNRQPGVQEANLGEKGIYHRLVAGPASSKEEANALCTQLKASGHTSCWITAVK